MLEKFITKSEVCLNLGHPTPLGYLALIVIVFLGLIAWGLKRRK